VTSLRYKGAVITRTGLAYTVWTDFVTEISWQPRFDTVTKAKAHVTAVRS
jgi:hypothetical protein